MALDLSKLEKVKQKGDRIECQCPACFEAGTDKTGNHLIIQPDGAFGCVMNPGDKIHRRRIAELAGLPDETRQTTPTRQNPYVSSQTAKNGSHKSVETRFDERGEVQLPARTEICRYAYKDARGAVVYEIARYEPKDFRPFLPGAQNAGIGKTPRVPYRLPEILAATGPAFIVEGERDADNLTALGYAATCRAGGSSSWEDELTPWFAGKDVILCGDNDKPGEKYMVLLETFLKPVAKSVRRVWVPKPHKDISDALEGLSDEEGKALIESMLIHPIAADLEKRRFDITKPPVRTEPVLFINGVGIAKAGDLVVIQAQVKSGKSSMLGAMMGCLMGQSRTDCDFLGVVGSNPKGLPVLHFDTEQNTEDYFDLISRSLTRAKIDSPPSWLYSYWLTNLTAKQRREYIFYESKRQKELHGALCAIFIDGVGDLSEDVNDATATNALVDDLYALAIECMGPLVAILHENPGDNQTGKTRGHLGSQLERKAASNLRLSKDEKGVIQLYSERLRRGHIAKGSGPHFLWNEEEQMHTSCETSGEVKAQARDKEKVQKLFESAGDIMRESSGIRHTELVDKIMKREAVSDKTARRRIEDMRDLGMLNYSFYMYSLNSQFKP